MSGTSMAAPMVSGAVALLLQDEPRLTPDQVKYRLTSTANKTWAGYNANKAGAGYLDAYAAVTGTSTNSTNTGLTASTLLTTGTPADHQHRLLEFGLVELGFVEQRFLEFGFVEFGLLEQCLLEFGLLEQRLLGELRSGLPKISCLTKVIR